MLNENLYLKKTSFFLISASWQGNISHFNIDYLDVLK